MAYNGNYGLIGLLNRDGQTYTKFPIKYIRYQTYKVTPDQNQDLDSTVDTTGRLHRYPLGHTRSKVEFNTPYITNADMNAIITLLSSRWNSPNERKVGIRYYDPLTDAYKTGDFYIPDIDFTIRNIDEDHGLINYEETRFAFIEY